MKHNQGILSYPLLYLYSYSLCEPVTCATNDDIEGKGRQHNSFSFQPPYSSVSQSLRVLVECTHSKK